ncbi:aminotransferase class I/II-fold pyridoxal phosphate-dependent enzyme, partial [Streptococcus anginosus]
VKHDLHYDPRSEIVVTVGGSEAIDMVCRAIINPGDEVICIDPSYVSYAPSIKLADGVVVPVTLRADRNFILTPEDLEAAITPQTKAMIINFPNNPT